ncbi:MAG: hypothetical protein MZW92_03695 [Comamonadaceae bacterium]|nr:hypothetical protein [Comamonadaceae bacterium]
MLEGKKIRAGAPRPRASTTPCCAPAARARTTPAACPPTKAGRPSSWWSTSATSSSSTPSSPAAAPPTRPSPTRARHRIRLADLRDAADARAPARRCGSTRWRSTRRALRAASRARSPPTWPSLARSLEAQGHAPGGRRRASSPAACSPCSPRTWACCRHRAFSELLATAARAPRPSSCPWCGELWHGHGRAAASRSRCAPNCCASTASCSSEPARAAAGAATQIGAPDRGRPRRTGREVEPAIFGTLLERALDPAGAPRPRRPLHAARLCRTAGAAHGDRAAARRLGQRPGRRPAAGRRRQARAKRAQPTVRALPPPPVRARGCSTRPAAPATSSTSTLEHMKRLEGEVLEPAGRPGRRSLSLETEGLSVDPHQFLGLETQPARRGHRRTGAVDRLPAMALPHPRQRPRRPSRCCATSATSNAATPCSPTTRMEYVLDARRRPGHAAGTARTMKKHPVTGEDVPDETPACRWSATSNPRQAEWPQADFVVGNPPFIGNKRDARGAGRRLRRGAARRLARRARESPTSSCTGGTTPPQLVREGRAPALRPHHHQQPAPDLQPARHRAIAPHRRTMERAAVAGVSPSPITPWVDSRPSGAARRAIAMTVGARRADSERRRRACRHRSHSERSRTATVDEATQSSDMQSASRATGGRIHADLDSRRRCRRHAVPLRAERRHLSCPGVKLHRRRLHRSRPRKRATSASAPTPA